MGTCISFGAKPFFKFSRDMYSEKQLEDFYLLHPFIGTTIKANKILPTKSTKRILIDGYRTTPLLDIEELKRIKKYVDQTLELYKESNLSEDLRRTINTRKAKEYSEEHEINRQREQKRYLSGIYLYLIQNPITNDLKIGISNEPQRRIEELQNTNGRQLNLLYTIPGKSNLEKTLHDKFSHLRLKGEWFKYDQSIIQEFERLAAEVE